MNPVKIEFVFTLEDWIAFHRFHTRHAAYTKRVYRIGLLAFPVIWALILLIDVMRQRATIKEAAIFGGLSLLWVWLLTRSRTRKASDTRFRKMLAGDNSTILGRQVLTAGAEGITVTYPMAESKFRWQAIKKLAETDDHYFLYDTAMSALIIPKTLVTGDVAALDELLRQKIAVQA